MKKAIKTLRDKILVQILWIRIRYVGWWITLIYIFLTAKKYGFTEDDPVVVSFSDYWDYTMTEFYKNVGLNYHEEKRKRGES